MPAETFRARLARAPMVFDGAMGTELYRRGQFINKPFEGVNLTDPVLVEQVHREYVAAGADAIETNTFASSRAKLRRVGLEDQHDAINRAGVRLARAAAGDRAWVVGAIGPTGAWWDQSTPEVRAAHVADLVDQAKILLEEGVDALMLESYQCAEELYAVLEAIRPLTTQVVFAQASFSGNGVTLDKVTPAELAAQLIARGADVVGANCADGPSELFSIAEEMVPCGHPVSIMPNAGYPKRVDDRMIYMATPEYFGVYARRYLKIGVRCIGGCCGTSPEHIRSMVGAARMMAGGAAVPDERVHVLAVKRRDEELPAIPMPQRSRLAAKVASGEGFVVSVEVNPPTGLDLSRSIEAARMLQAAGVDVINIADGPRASVRTANWALALTVQRELAMESILHVCMRDRNLLGLQSDILAYQQFGLNNLVVITGDPPKMGDYPHATAVFDLDSIGGLQMVRDMNHGLNPAGRALGGQTSFFVACGVEPAALDYDRELRRLEQKISAGAELIMTQPVYDPAILERFLDDTASLGVPVLVGLLPLASERNAEFLHNEVPGMQIPPEIRARMARVGTGPRARAEGVKIAQEALLAVKNRVRGAYIMPPFARYEAAIEILQVVGYEIPEGWRDGWKA